AVPSRVVAAVRRASVSRTGWRACSDQLVEPPKRAVPIPCQWKAVEMMDPCAGRGTSPARAWPKAGAPVPTAGEGAGLTSDTRDPHTCRVVSRACRYTGFFLGPATTWAWGVL